MGSTPTFLRLVLCSVVVVCLCACAYGSIVRACALVGSSLTVWRLGMAKDGGIPAEPGVVSEPKWVREQREREAALQRTINLAVAEVTRLEVELRQARVTERRARAELGKLQLEG